MTVNFDSEMITSYQQYVAGSINDFLPLVTVFIGLFMAFAIANMLRHFLIKVMK